MAVSADARDRVLDAEAAPGAAPERIGAKAASLAALARLELPVPPFACVTTAVWDDLVARLPADLLEELERPPEDAQRLAEVGRRARELLVAGGLAPADAARLGGVADTVAGPAGAVSVRSSAVGEDSARHSFAGQFETDLWVPVEEVADRVLSCFASALGDRALVYRRVHGLGLDAARMAVTVQRMVDSAAAGVAFTVDPVEPRSDRVLVVAGLGLGQGVVDGTVPTDSFRLDPTGRVEEREIAAKATRVERAPDGRGTVLADVPADEAARPALTDAQAEEVAGIALRVAAARGAPQDVEWALDREGSLRLLQARPVTTEPAAPAAGRETVFDDSNLVESFPGVTSPLTFSLMRKAYEHNFGGLVEAFGLRREVVERDGEMYENLIGTLSGHAYYNLSNWYRILLQIPGLERAVPAFEKAMGFEGDAPASARRLSRLDRLRWLPGQVRVGTRLLIGWLGLGSRVREWQATYRTLAAEHRALELDRLDAHELLDRVERTNRELFWRMTAAPMNDFFTQQLYALVGKAIGAWSLGDPDSMRNELMCGETGMESVEPVRSLVRLTERVARDEPTRALVESPGGAAEVYAEIERDPRFAGVRDALREHVERFGDRSLGELKLETTTLTDDPAPLIEILRNLLRGGRTVEAMEEHEQRIRAEAEAAVRQRLRGDPLRRAVFAFLLRRCRWGLKARESMRLTRGSIVAMFRGLYRALGDRFVEAGVLDAREDVFLLTVDEVGDAVRGASVTEDLRGVVAIRRRELAAAADRSMPSRVRMRGIVAGADRGADPGAAGAPAADGTLTGVGCAPGRVRARAMVIEEPRADLRIDGQVLVARTTDPGWVFLMVAAGGLVSEQGNVLSHTAIIGRELGIPTVVGVPGATRSLAGGVEVELDGRAGTVTVV